MVVVQEPVKAIPLFTHSFDLNMMFSMTCLSSCSDDTLISEEKFDSKKTLVRISSNDLDLFSVLHLSFGLDAGYPDTVCMIFVVCSKQMVG